MGVHSKLEIINSFHRTLGLLLDKFMIYLNTNRWIDIIGDVVNNYNHRIHRILGQAPNDITRRDISKLNKKLRIKNKPSLLKLHQYRVGDRVRYLFVKNLFSKGGKKFSKNIWTITAIKNYNLRIELNGLVVYKKYWELLMVD